MTTNGRYCWGGGEEGYEESMIRRLSRKTEEILAYVFDINIIVLQSEGIWEAPAHPAHQSLPSGCGAPGGAADQLLAL